MPTTVTDAAYSARPRIKVDGQEPTSVVENLLAATLDEQEGGLATLELRFLNIRSREDGSAELAFDDDDALGLGKQIELGMGEDVGPSSMFKGKISAIQERYGKDGPPELVVLADDPLMGARQARRTKVYTDTTLGDLVQTVASGLGLRASTTGLSDSIALEVQLNESDLAFLRRVLHAHDADLQIVDEEIQALPMKDRQRGAVELNAINDFVQLRVGADLAHQVTQVTVTGWDDRNGERIGVTSDPGDLGPGSGRTGAAATNQVYGARSEHLGQIPVATTAEAQALADAAHRQRARGFVRIEATANGDARLRVGTRLTLRGAGRRFNNTYVITRATHRFDMVSGYETDLEAECAYLSEGS